MSSRTYGTRCGSKECVQSPSRISYELFSNINESESNSAVEASIKMPHDRRTCIMISIDNNQSIVTNKLKRVVLIGISPNNDRLYLGQHLMRERDESKQTAFLHPKVRRTRFRLFYENGEERDVEATNSSYLYTFLIRQCRKSNK